MEKHIIEEGSRQHVISYQLYKGRGQEICSEPNCEVNKDLEKVTNKELDLEPCKHGDYEFNPEMGLVCEDCGLSKDTVGLEEENKALWSYVDELAVVLDKIREKALTGHAHPDMTDIELLAYDAVMRYNVRKK